MSTPEGKIQKKILDYLKDKGVFHWRQNNGALWDNKLKIYRTHTGMKGVPDIIAVIDGQFVGIEVKTPKGKQSADQLLFQKRLERNGGKYILAKCVEDVSAAFAS